jgi:hypothetical protein
VLLAVKNEGHEDARQGMRKRSQNDDKRGNELDKDEQRKR